MERLSPRRLRMVIHPERNREPPAWEAPGFLLRRSAVDQSREKMRSMYQNMSATDANSDSEAAT